MLGISYLFPDSPRWYVEAHPFRIDTSDGIGRPTPEGAHRDGVDYVVVILVDRVGVKVEKLGFLKHKARLACGLPYRILGRPWF